jgi:hypothetical protein
MFCTSLFFMFSDCVSFLAYPKIFGIKGFVVVLHLLFITFPSLHYYSCLHCNRVMSQLPVILSCVIASCTKKWHVNEIVIYSQVQWVTLFNLTNSN